MAADYRQYDSIEKRVRYFDGQFLKDQDFVDEQKYQLDRQRRPLRFLHTSGIIAGLTVESGSQQSPDDVDRAFVQPGTAINRQGQQIVLGNVKDLPLKAYRNQSVEVFISYQEIAADVSQEGGESNRRWHEDPLITVQAVGASPPEDAVRLAKLNINGDGNVTPDADTAVRQYAGIKLPSAENANLTLRSRGNTAKSWAILTGSLNITDQLGIGIANPNAKLEVKLATPSTEASLKLDHNGSNLIVRPLTAGGNASVVENTGGALLINPTGGNVGIGNSEASNRLHISGSTGIRQNYLYLSGSAGGSSFSYNAHRNSANSDWVFPDKTRAALTVEMDDLAGKQPRFEIYSTTSSNTSSWIQRFAVDGNTGNVVIAPTGGTVGIGTAAGTPKLTVSAANDHLQLLRGGNETPGKVLFLELFQASKAGLSEVHPSIRFHHSSLFWHRIEGRSDGFHFKTGDLKSDTYVKIFAENMVVTGMIVMWSGQADNIPTGWRLCNGANNTPDLQDRFIVGAGRTYGVGNAGGADAIALNVNQIPSHNHSLDFDDGGGGYNSVTSGSMAKSDRQTNVLANYSVQTNYTGGNQAHENRPPYYALCFIMKT